MALLERFFWYKYGQEVYAGSIVCGVSGNFGRLLQGPFIDKSFIVSQINFLKFRFRNISHFVTFYQISFENAG